MRLRWLCVLFAGLSCAQVVLATGPPTPAPGDGPAPAGGSLTAVLLYPDRPPVLLDAVSPTTLQPSRLDDLTAAWVWSRRTPPRRLTADELRRDLAVSMAGDDGPSVTPLAVHVPPGVETPEEDLTVVAAPRAMFGEVPERWLPRWPLSSQGAARVPRWAGIPWRLRLLGRDRGGAWRDVGAGEREAVLAPAPAGAVQMVIADRDGNPLPDAYLTMLEDLHGRSAPGILCQEKGDARGVVRIPAFPADLAVSLVAGAPGHASLALRGRPTDLPTVLRLPSGATVRGRFVNGDGLAVPGVEVRLEGWLADELPVRFERRSESGESGTWGVAALPPRRLALLASRAGYAPLRQTLDLREGEVVDLGELTLVRGADLGVVVRDDRGVPVPGAVVRAGSVTAVTGAEGGALLQDLPAGGDVELRTRTDGFLDDATGVRAPWPRRAEVVLTRAFVVRGTFLGADGLPVSAGTVRVETGNAFRFEELDAGGRFALALEPAVDHTLRFASPTTARLDREVAPGRPGETRDLGELAPPPGVVVRGVLLSALDGLPVAAARVWTPRPSTDPVGSWLHGDVLEARSDELGRFVLAGLAARPEELRVDADGYARRQVPVRPEDGASQLDLGAVELSPGARLQVRLPNAGTAMDGATARLDLRGRWLDLDMITAVVADGEAEIPHVPVGEALLTVLSGGELVCEERVEVEPGDDRVEVVCEDDGRSVTGVVLAAGRPLGPGTLEWQSGEDETTVKATILTRRSALGLRQQQVVGRGRPPVHVEVGEDGTFVSDRLAPGRWSVVWWPTDGDPAAPRSVEVPEGPAPRVAVRIGGGTVSGRVSDEEGRPVEGVWVRELDGGGLGRTGADGSFRISGLEPGRIRLQARDQERFSRVAEIRVEEDRPAEPVQLTLSAEHPGRLPVRVWTGGGAPASGAFVFLDLGERGMRVVSADGAGRVKLAAAAPYPDRARLAAFHAGNWVFGRWTAWDRLGEGSELELPASGELLVESEERRGRLAVLSPGGWDLSRLLELLGSSPSVSPDHPLLLAGLPEGTYRVGGQRAVTVRADRRERVELE